MTDKKIIVGPVDTIIFFGGGIFLIECVRECIKRGLKAYIFINSKKVRASNNQLL